VRFFESALELSILPLLPSYRADVPFAPAPHTPSSPALPLDPSFPFTDYPVYFHRPNSAFCSRVKITLLFFDFSRWFSLDRNHIFSRLYSQADPPFFTFQSFATLRCGPQPPPPAASSSRFPLVFMFKWDFLSSLWLKVHPLRRPMTVFVIPREERPPLSVPHFLPLFLLLVFSPKVDKGASLRSCLSVTRRFIIPWSNLDINSPFPYISPEGGRQPYYSYAHQL